MAQKSDRNARVPQWKGPVIAYNNQGYITPVFYDPHTAINSGKGSMTNGALITGSPGSGKSFAGMNLAMMSAVSGKKTIFLDPKNDSLGMLNLKDWVDGKMNRLDINDSELFGAMDPFIAQPTIELKVSKAYALLSILLGPFNDEQESILYPIVQDVANDPVGSMTLMNIKLNRHADRSLNALGTRLAAIKGSSPSSSLIFGKIGDGTPEIKPVTFNDGMTIISMLGLDLPSNDADPRNYQAAQRLGMGILYLITDYILETMKNPDEREKPKTIIIDEAWAIAATKTGYDTLASLLRLGRSFNTAVILMSQNVSDLESSDGNNRLLNSVNTKFAFRCNDTEEAKHLCDSFDISYSFCDEFLDLIQGQCVMKDYKKRVAKISILPQCEEWSRAFETNPFKRTQNKKAIAENAADDYDDDNVMDDDTNDDIEPF